MTRNFSDETCRLGNQRETMPWHFPAIGIFVLLLTATNTDAVEVPWLHEVTTVPTITNAEPLERMAPLLADESGHVVASLEEWKERRIVIREQWMTFLGPMPERRPAIKLEVLRTERLETLTRQLVRYEGEPGVSVEGYLLVPHNTADKPQKRPGILALHPTTDSTIDDIAGVSGSETKQFGLKFAQRGFVVFCPRCFLWQDAATFEIAVASHRARHPNSLGMAKMLYDAMRGIDVLVAHPEVDADRIGVIGHSLGAKESLYLAAFDERVKVAVASEGGISFRSTNWDAPWYLGAAINAPNFLLNHHQLLGLIAPRPFLILGGEAGPGAADGNRSWPLIAAAFPVWSLYGEPVRLGLWNHHQGHTVSPESFERMAQWLTTYLQ
jgi:dienelactone hydrolase